LGRAVWAVSRGRAFLAAPACLRVPADPAARKPGGQIAAGNAVVQALAALQATASDANHTPAQVREKVSAVRAARQKARADLDAAQEDLRQLLTADQEALLISQGYLD